MRQKEIFFMPLGAAQSVGRSCYYLRLGQSNILLDCGLQRINGAICTPDLHSLLTSQFMESMQQLDQVYISHAHTDHVGYLPQVMQMAPQASVYMTLQTKQLAKYRLTVNSNQQGAAEASRLLSGVAPVNYLQKIKQRDYSVTFFPAGHIPGAMMTLFEYAGRKILYTGDFSLHSAFGLDGCWLPDDLEIDVLLMCALHAKQPYSIRQKNTLQQRITEVMNSLRWGQSVYLQAFDAGRVLELLMAAPVGATMVIAPPTVYGGVELAALLAEHRVTHAFVTPAALATVPPEGLDELRLIVFPTVVGPGKRLFDDGNQTFVARFVGVEW